MFIVVDMSVGFYNYICRLTKIAGSGAQIRIRIRSSKVGTDLWIRIRTKMSRIEPQNLLLGEYGLVR
jgi:hypothetical protein